MHGDINMNVVRDDNENPCVDPTAIMNYTMGHSNIIGNATTNYTPYIYQNELMYDTTDQTDTIVDNTQLHLQPQPFANVGSSYYSGPSASPTIIQCKLYFLIAAHKNVQTGKEFVAVARITNGQENPFVNARGTAFHYSAEVRHQQFNTVIPLSQKELTGAVCDDRAFAVHKTTGTSCAPAGTYLVYRLRRSESGTRNLRFEAIWDWGNGFVGKASYDFVSLTAYDDFVMKSYIVDVVLPQPRSPKMLNVAKSTGKQAKVYLIVTSLKVVSAFDSAHCNIEDSVKGP
ncbi:hypothetical protein FHL15_005651 [Xylaria flabelliformis]|uniref:Uncharacterized protein n=1 Tax=Xylaria flabelliformis TaxID=2512241 RepID=A0A553HZJ7_9PEZI|nr:hypothetical protein FHL15_005651 [Xylaria flabelliformis]